MTGIRGRCFIALPAYHQGTIPKAGQSWPAWLSWLIDTKGVSSQNATKAGQIWPACPPIPVRAELFAAEDGAEEEESRVNSDWEGEARSLPNQGRPAPRFHDTARVCLFWEGGGWANPGKALLENGLERLRIILCRCQSGAPRYAATAKYLFRRY